MATLKQIQFKRSKTAGQLPAASVLAEGELAINLKDKAIFTKDDSGNVIELGLKYGGTIDGSLTVNGNITGTLIGNSSTATKLQTPRKINGISFDGSKDITLTPSDINVNSTTFIKNNGELPVDANLDEYGPVEEYLGVWSKSTSTNAQPANKFPEENAVGVLEVFVAGQFAGTQRYTVRSGNVYVRSLSAKWNGVNGPWGVWRNVQASTRPLSQTIDLDSLGELEHCGLWRNSSSAIASFDRHYPEEGSAAQGFLEIFEGGLYTRTQRYTTRMGMVYTRCLAAAWDASAPKWEEWKQVGHGTPATFYDGDLNDFKTPGLYNILGTDAVINCPTGEGLPAVIVGLLEVKQRASGGAIFQKFTTAGTGETTRDRIFERAYTGGAWGAWNEVYTSYSLPITLGMGGIKAQLSELDWQTFDFVPGSMFSVPLNKIKNMPANMDWGTIDGNLVMFSVGPSEHTGTGRTVQVWRGTVSQTNYRYFVVRIAGNPGNRTNTCRRVVLEDGSHTWTAQQNFRGLLNITADINLGANKKISIAPGAYIQGPASGSGSNTYANQNTTIAPLYQAIDDSNKNQFAPIVKQKNTVTNITMASGMDIASSEYRIIAQGDLSATGTTANELATWRFLPSGRFMSQSRVYAGAAFLNTDGNIAGSIWKKYNDATNLDAALNTRVGKSGDIMTGRLTIQSPGDSIVLSAPASNSLHIRGDVDGTGNWYIGKGGDDNGLAFYSYATNAGVYITNAGDITLSPKGVEMAHVNNIRLYVHGERWTASQPGDWGNQWRVEAPIFVDHGYVGSDSYYPIIKGRSVVTNQGFVTAVDLGIRRVPNNWGQAIIRVGSAEASPAAGHPNAVFEFHYDGTFYSPGNGNFNDVYIRSDGRLKINKEELENGALEKVCRLKVYTYDKVKSIKDRSVIKREVGIIAQDLEKELPEAVSKVEVDGSDVLTISNSAVNALLIKAIQEMSEEIKELKTPFFTKIARKISNYFKF
ncbi:long tail fiber protein distal subunit [Escherichia phage vB_VIPECOOM01]|uniref:Long tail fiber protein Gp37 n=3 Tax=Tequatrovirus vipecoom TaxID=3350239 RepID=A0AAF0FHK2_9CAUD|nr:long tail fiber protein distal subunit [Escherichia phage vB_VIPECOOM01]WFG78138.1 long tail fiber protein distal subunit [Escherichia phage vB_VIPECOOM02]WFG78407.1 long tail fiber protein distal subunit [Escherichia phage vB_VIPECOOM03]